MKRRWLFWLLVIAFVWIVATRISDIEKLLEILVQGDWQWIVAALLLQFLYFVVYTVLYQRAFIAVGMFIRLRELLPVVFASYFVDVAAPSGGLSIVALFADDAAQHGRSPVKATAGVLLAHAGQFAAFLVVLIFALVYLYRKQNLQSYEVVAGTILILITLGLSGVLLLGLYRPKVLHNLLHWVQAWVNRIAGKIRLGQPLGEEWADKTVLQFAEAAVAIHTNYVEVILIIVAGLTMQFLNVITVSALFVAFHEQIGFTALIAGYAMGMLFWIVSVTPQGVGIVEGIMAVVYTSLGVPPHRATVIALTFRGLSFWLPLIIGFLFLRRIRSLGAK